MNVLLSQRVPSLSGDFESTVLVKTDSTELPEWTLRLSGKSIRNAWHLSSSVINLGTIIQGQAREEVLAVEHKRAGIKVKLSSVAGGDWFSVKPAEQQASMSATSFHIAVEPSAAPGNYGGHIDLLIDTDRVHTVRVPVMAAIKSPVFCIPQSIVYNVGGGKQAPSKKILICSRHNIEAEIAKVATSSPVLSVTHLTHTRDPGSVKDLSLRAWPPNAFAAFDLALEKHAGHSGKSVKESVTVSTMEGYSCSIDVTIVAL